MAGWPSTPAATRPLDSAVLPLSPTEFDVCTTWRKGWPNGKPGYFAERGLGWQRRHAQQLVDVCVHRLSASWTNTGRQEPHRHLEGAGYCSGRDGLSLRVPTIVDANLPGFVRFAR